MLLPACRFKKFKRIILNIHFSGFSTGLGVLNFLALNHWNGSDKLTQSTKQECHGFGHKCIDGIDTLLHAAIETSYINKKKGRQTDKPQCELRQQKQTPNFATPNLLRTSWTPGCSAAVRGQTTLAQQGHRAPTPAGIALKLSSHGLPPFTICILDIETRPLSWKGNSLWGGLVRPVPFTSSTCMIRTVLTDSLQS